MSEDFGGDRGEPIPDVAALTEPTDTTFTDRVMEGINLRTVIHDSVESQWPVWVGAFREFLELIFGLLGHSRKEDSDG